MVTLLCLYRVLHEMTVMRFLFSARNAIERVLESNFLRNCYSYVIEKLSSNE